MTTPTTDATDAAEQTFREWTILELMGHRQLAGLLAEVELAGEKFLRIDIYDVGDQAKATQLYRPAAVYCITPTTEEIARAFTRRYWMPPMTRLQLDPPRRTADQMDDHGRDEELDDDIAGSYVGGEAAF